jgi:RimJ/RimL family protein N-acetyltransferase
MKSLKSILPHDLKTSRLTLQLFDYSPAHYECLLASMNSPTAHKNMGDFGIRTPEAFDELNISTRLSPAIFPSPITVDTDVYYILSLGNGEPLIGGVSIAQRNPIIPPDVGWCVLEEYQMNGYATEAAKELLKMVREHLKIKEVIAWPGQQNLPSQKVALRVGFVEGGSTRDENGEEVVIYVLPGMDFDGISTLSLYGQ